MTPNKLIAMAEKLEQAEQSRYVAKLSPVMKEAAAMLRDLAGEMSEARSREAKRQLIHLPD